ncbi:C protein [Agrobacterium rhizogenes]|uniref:C protein n=1 Tax=Rhizobium rhizogenes TaxID=359 RepID=UPI00157475EE|nr:C protein [Rhizobium rhizogenes]NTF91496.1 C protein [Rhizobium rhizogenes]
MENLSSANLAVDEKLERSWFHHLHFKKIIASNILGGPYSYVTEETDVGQEADCIKGYSATLTQENGLEALHQLQPISALSFTQDPRVQADASSPKAAQEIPAPPSEDGMSDKSYIFDVNPKSNLTDTLISMPPCTRNAYAARARRERNEAYQCILRMPELPPRAKKYLQQNITSIQRQEKRWRQSSQMPCSERALFWLWLAVMQAAVVVPDIVSGFLGAAIAVLRSGPITLQTQLMVLAIFDYPWADERLARFLACEIFLGGLPAVLFGILAIAMPSHKGTAVHGTKDVAWKATVCILWQILMQNRKNIQDLFNYASFRRKKIPVAQRADFNLQYEKLKTSSAIVYSWFDTFHVSNRLRTQIGYHKQDHEDILKALRWVSDITDDEMGNPRGSKAGILAAILVMAALICLSTFPIDPYSGLIAMGNMVPLAVRAAVDVMDKSQSSHDLLRLFTATAGISFPSTLFMVTNMVYWLLKGKALFIDLSSIQFWLSFVLIFFMSLFPKLWGKMFMRFGSRCLDGELAP